MSVTKQSKEILAVSYDLKDVFDILQKSSNKKVTETKKVRPTFIDTFLYSGRFNSVLGLDGFQLFKDQLKDVVKKVNSDDFKSNYINLDSMFEVLLSSGVYYVEDHLPEELKIMKTNSRWLTAYRYVAKNFTKINYKEFREIVKRLKDSDGHSFYIKPDDTDALLSITKNMELFRESIDAEAALLQLTQKELKTICDRIGIKAARSIEDTVKKIIEIHGQDAITHLPDNAKSRRTLFIKDEELATGNDIVELDEYLRQIAKVVREDLVAFIDKQRNGMIAA